MKNRQKMALVGAAVFVLAGIGEVSAQGQTPAGNPPAVQVQTPPPVPAAKPIQPPTQAQPSKGKGCNARFDQLDTNHDGKLTSAEYMAVPHPKLKKPEERFKKWDTNQDGVLSKEEFCIKGDKPEADVE
jgi:hypothetical protein